MKQTAINLFSLLSLVWFQLPAATASEQPNVVILLADDLGSKDLGCYGGPVKTPVLDSLAARGVKFTDFHAGAAICSPSRATLLTGRQNLRTGIYGVLQDHMHEMHLLEREVTIAEVLQEAGYGTAHFGKWHIGMTSGKRVKPSPTEHGFDYWFGLSNGAQPSHRNPTNFIRNGKRVGPMQGYSCQIVVDDAINWLETKPDSDEPFFLNIWFNEPHSKLAAPDEIVSLYGDLKNEGAIYSATIDNTDRAIGRLVEKLEAMGELDKTIIIYSSDHGSYREDRNGGLKGNKGSGFQGGLRSPGIFFWPDGIRGGRIEATPSGAVDLLPTICGLAGIDPPKGVYLDGADLSPLLVEKGEFKRAQPLFWLNPASGHLATLREGRYTLMGYRGYELPFPRKQHDEIVKKLAELAGIDPSLPNLSTRVNNTTFSSPEFNRLRGEKVRLQTFQESWIPIIKKGGFSRFALYDLESDPRQEKDIYKQRPKVTERLKETLLTLYEDVLEDAPDWPAAKNEAPFRQRKASGSEKPNVLFLAVDDLNDWVGCLDGHPQAKTPNIDRLASRGVLFENAHCAAPLCHPSRTAIMTGLRPSTTGVYGNLNWFRDLPKYKDWVTLPQYFRQHGYLAWGGGKLYHQAHGKFSDAEAWDHVYSTRTGALPPPEGERYQHGLRPKFESNPILARLIDWGPTDHPIEANPDWKTADGAAQFLQREHDKPFFLGCGIYLPHLPWYAPKEFFERHPLEDIQLPPHHPDDFDDIPAIGQRMGGPHIKHIRESGQWKEAVQACLAADSFADACVGHVLDALEKSPHRDNTIIVLWGDHGYDVGEKKIAKSALWEQTTRTPLIIHVPEKLRDETWNPSTTVSRRPVSLLDLYPTLIELCGLPANDKIEGRSLAPLVRNPEADWPWPAVITHSPHWVGFNHAIRSERWHYIHYSDGGEELYDTVADPFQWYNLASEPDHAATKKELKPWLPKSNAPHFRGESK